MRYFALIVFTVGLIIGCDDDRTPEVLKRVDELNAKCKADCAPREADTITYSGFLSSYSYCKCKVSN